MSMRRPAVLAGGLLTVGLLAAVSSPGQPQPPPLIYGGDHRFPPYEYLGPTGQPEGYNVELVREIARHAGRDVVFRLGYWRDILAQFDAGQIDLISLAWSAARAERYDLLVQTWTLKQGLVFRSGRSSYPQGLDELAGEVVAVEENGSTHELFRRLPEDKRPVIRPAPDHRVALQMVVHGEAPAAVGNALTLRYVASELELRGLTEVHAKANSYHLASQKGRANELAWIPIAYARLGEDGTRDRLVEKHLALRPSPRNWGAIVWPFALVVALLGSGAA